jgi:hypothetical protein
LLANYSEKCGVTRKTFVFIYRLAYETNRINIKTCVGNHRIDFSKCHISTYICCPFHKICRYCNETILSEDIKNGEVKNADLGTDSVTTTKIKNGEVKTEDLASDAIQPNVHLVVGNGKEIPPGGVESDVADCPPGEVVTGGGFVVGDDVVVIASLPNFGDNGWFVRAKNFDTSNGESLIADALCIGPSP